MQYASFLIYCDSKETECAFKNNINAGENCVYIVNDKIKDAVERVLMTKAQIEETDIICFINDFRDSSLKFDSVNESYLYRAHSSLVGNEIYVKNVINLFAANERLGLLVTPTPNHADYYPTCGCFDWGDNFEETVKLAEYLDIKSNINITINNLSKIF